MFQFGMGVKIHFHVAGYLLASKIKVKQTANHWKEIVLLEVRSPDVLLQ